jgi:hypothetical protein
MRGLLLIVGVILIYTAANGTLMRIIEAGIASASKSSATSNSGGSSRVG